MHLLHSAYLSYIRPGIFLGFDFLRSVKEA